MRYGDGDAQPGQYPNDNLEWIEPESNPKDIGQRLAKQLTRGPIIDPSEGCEIAKTPKEKGFPGAIVIKPKNIAEEEAKNIYRPEKINSDLIIWSDRSKLETEGVGTGIALKQGITWLQKGYPLGKTKEVFDAELYGIKSALDIAINKLSRNPYIKRLIVLSDSQAALLRVSTDYLGPGQAIAIDISVRAQTLVDKGIEVILQ